ncbi:7402_t:CDS:2 [Cetraspora pellucida]|uniref:7402_t:CDS:1 n=1 Tax=Cetraspora pellucida TaxID=1433469 RepID=A0ACA9MME5_9GLOM|nr:7402_t:CDS:2 [Cetraspora pellucida]
MSKQNAQQTQYRGGETLARIPTRNDIISECDNGLTAILQQNLPNKQPIYFIPNDVSDATEYINKVSTYILRIYGTLINGQKARVDITGIKPFFDVAMPDNEPLSIFKPRLVKIILGSEKIDKSKFGIKVIHVYPIRGYHTEKKVYIRIITWNHYDRTRILKEVRKYGIETVSDDITNMHYYQKIAREKKLPLSEWAILNDYHYNPSTNLPHYSYYFRISVDNYRPLGENKPNNLIISKVLSHDRILVLTWDIETYSSRKMGDLPDARNEKDQVFMICMTVHWKDNPKPLLQICLVDMETKPDPEWITVICGNQINLLKAFALCWKNLAPDIQIGFNDSQYDWPFIIEKAKSLDILEWMYNHMSPESSNIEKILKWNYRKSEIKIYDEKFYSKYLKIPGCIPIDVRACFKKLYQKSEASSLKYYLEECGLGSKADMPITTMNKIYEDAILHPSDTSAKNMCEIAHYCIIDALRCQELMVKHNVVNDYREVSSIAYVSLSDAHYFAEGMKVYNLLGAEAWSSNMLCSMIASENTESGKYPGAYVITPIKGLENKRPVTGLDFASLYPSLIMTYNLSPNKIILSREEAINVIRSGKKIHMIKFLFNGQTIEAWSIRHNNIPEEKGLYARVLENLFNKRKKMKKCLNKLDEESFEYSCLDSKQKAVKLYMNTFYDEAGNNLSPFYQLQLAGGVTSAGQHNIKFVKKFVEDKEFGVKYEDTDSLYLTCPEECFQECDRKYKLDQLSQEEYWEEMVKISIEVMANLRNKVNTELEKDNGMPYLNMAYEEVLFPVVFTGKKKYYGLEHKKKPNFNPGKLFIRGVDIVKRGQSKLFCDVGKEIMNRTLKVGNEETIHQIVEKVLWENVEKLSKLDYDEFIQTCIWRPKKEGKQENISVERFVSRMEAKYSREVLENQQLIKKVPEEIYNNCGKKIPQQKGDCMEYPDVVKKFNKKINIDYYIESLFGLCARFINYDDKYQPSPESLSKVLDRKKKSKEKKLKISQKSAKKWLKNYIKNLRDAPKKEEAIICHLWKDATTHAEKICSGISRAGIINNDFLNVLDKIADSIRLKLSDLLSKLSKLNVEYRNRLYELIMQAQKYKTDITILEEYIFRYNLESECKALIDFRNTWYKVTGLEIARFQALSIMQNSKKDNPSESDIDEIVDLYC